MTTTGVPVADERIREMVSRHFLVAEVVEPTALHLVCSACDDETRWPDGVAGPSVAAMAELEAIHRARVADGLRGDVLGIAADVIADVTSALCSRPLKVERVGPGQRMVVVDALLVTLDESEADGA